jgi:hypothetical protein
MAHLIGTWLPIVIGILTAIVLVLYVVWKKPDA